MANAKQIAQKLASLTPAEKACVSMICSYCSALFSSTSFLSAANRMSTTHRNGRKLCFYCSAEHMAHELIEVKICLHCDKAVTPDTSIAQDDDVLCLECADKQAQEKEVKKPTRLDDRAGRPGSRRNLAWTRE